MDFIQRIGGRKFWMALIVTGVATFLELKSPNGLTATMATFLAGIAGTFSVANYASAAKHADSRQGIGNGGITAEKLGNIEGMLKAGLGDPETAQALLGVMTKMNNDLEQVKATTGQIGIGVVNLGKR